MSITNQNQQQKKASPLDEADSKLSTTKKTKEKKQRLDLVLVETGMAESRHKAQGIIMAGQVYLKGQKMTKAGQNITEAQIPLLEIRGKTLAYVSRGGLKLEKAIKVWQISLQDKICADIGASTGGFTDCMLQNGAKYVYAVDSGYNQLDWKLRSHPQVCSMERCNARYLSEEQIPVKLDFISIDVSFISLKLILSPLFQLLHPQGEIVCLIKPQFEAGREQVGKKGVVRDPKVHEEVIQRVLEQSRAMGYFVKDVTFSPIKGPEGNIEYLARLCKEEGDYPSIDCAEVVAQSHSQEEHHESTTKLQPLS